MRLALFILMFFSRSFVQAAMLDVPADYATVQQALDVSLPGDTVRVARGVYLERLVLPDHTLLLTSHFLVTQDTTEILETVLDGDSLGTVLTIDTDGSGRQTVSGFTVRGGLGGWGGFGGTEIGGGVHVGLASDVVLQNLLLRDNVSEHSGSAIFTEWVGDHRSRMRLEFVHCLENPIVSVHDAHYRQIDVRTLESCIVRNLEIDGAMGFGQGVAVLSNDTLLVDRVIVRRVLQSVTDFVGYNSCKISDVAIENCITVDVYAGCLFDTLSVQRLFTRECLWDGSSTGVGVNFSGYAIVADSLSFECNRIYKDAGETYSPTMVYIASSPMHGSVSNLALRDNASGDSLPEGAGEDFNQMCRMLEMHGTDVQNLEVVRNTMHLGERVGAERTGVHGPLVKSVSLGDSLTMENLIFADNLIIDHQDYSDMDPDGYITGQGRSLYVLLGNDDPRLVLRNARFMNERLPNHAPENSGIGTISIGSTMCVDASWGTRSVLLEDIQIQNCDDGGLYVNDYATNSILRNFSIVNVNRMGLRYEAWRANLGAHEVSNGWIQGVNEQDMYLSYPYDWSLQRPISVYGTGDNLEVSQITVASCSTTSFTLSEFGWKNSLFYDNEYEHFFVPFAGPSGSTFQYCFVPEVLPGSQNLIGDAPNFDPFLGAPYLAADSPCIDAGDPNPIYSDPEDPANPDWAIWPSQGGLRNDIGFTGGPHAAVPDTDWVAVQPIERPVMPPGFTLSEPWPNPFNPTARIAYELAAPSEVRLSVHDLLGRRVAVLADGRQVAGRHEVLIDGSGWASGLYFLTLEAAGQSSTVKAILLR